MGVVVVVVGVILFSQCVGLVLKKNDTENCMISLQLSSFLFYLSQVEWNMTGNHTLCGCSDGIHTMRRIVCIVEEVA